MPENKAKCERVQNELMEIAAELTAMGDLIQGLFVNCEEMEPETPNGIKVLITDIRKRIDNLRKYVGGRGD